MQLEYMLTTGCVHHVYRERSTKGGMPKPHLIGRDRFGKKAEEGRFASNQRFLAISVWNVANQDSYDRAASVECCAHRQSQLSVVSWS
jgi:hypothetical protein